jgi:UDP-N-acetylglucosamine 2-epimerase (non-hydrolysing)/GDP/UDP-N,N'-diacetylbacillosamine 2-epimerase (hydrolysing)
MKRIGVVSVARSDYGILRPLLKRLHADADFDPALIAAGMHLMPEFGSTVAEIEADGFPIAARIEMPHGDAPGDMARAMGTGVGRFADAYERLRPDTLILLGDRFEMFAAGAAAQPFLIPIAHIAGGAITQGAIDDGFRHALTKLSHVHFVETIRHAGVLEHLGEARWRIHVTGALNLDNLRGIEWLNSADLYRRYGISLDPDKAPLLVTLHPVTREYGNTRRYAEALFAALDAYGGPAIFTYPNADTTGRLLIAMIEAHVRHRTYACAVPHLGTQGYFGLMRLACAMVGNSSSGIIEAASFRLPVVNIGTRQQGRPAGANVIHTGYGDGEILGAIRKAASPDFRASLAHLVNPYGDGRAAERIIGRLRALDLDDPRLLRKENPAELARDPLAPVRALRGQEV